MAVKYWTDRICCTWFQQIDSKSQNGFFYGMYGKQQLIHFGGKEMQDDMGIFRVQQADVA